ncbi:Peptidase C12 ubiquitin carboxyl-terminal hydrolase 1 [Penicillium mononematosum]|uniref:Peptidase C12 ubiquitin carboxyl-terminal hydrolase 1 n=1 Tax=Penicillium mononematosum TaxID=268346 RepID=UPI002548208D|nr:Peptidase C12 ubiquitin carboxyl-terminal hydrolase 1 [Penicillium mononematosum]KAJ6190088.1 Peptidase C12 ubiquitin carboxyl-terminal hydrolase 1 [Penicillium mononematosum]
MFNLGVQVINGQKTFIPLENNPEVHTHLCKNLGVSPSLTFHDILSTTPEMLSWIPRPVNALILLCDKPIYLAARSRVEHSIPEYLGSGADEPVLWMKQTIGHACGLMALLHVVTNLENGKYVLAGSELEKIVKRAVGLGPVERARLLYDSRFLEEAHMDAASEGSSIVPLPQEECGFHFIAFVKKDGKVWELNGGMNGPLLRGELEGDLLGEEGLDMTKNASFKILAVTRDINSASAKKLAQKSSSITLIQGNLDDPAAIFKNAKRVWGVFSVQTTNPKNDDERRQGIALIDESIKQGVKHFVYSSVDRGGEKSDRNPTAIPHFIFKHEIEKHLIEKTKGTDMQWTILRPAAFFENFTPDYFGKVFTTAWQMTLKGKPLQLIATSDIGFFAAAAFMDPEESKNHAFSLAGDELTFQQMSDIFKDLTGKDVPTTFRIPVWLMMAAVKDLGVMFKWFRDEGYGADIPALKKSNPSLKTFGDWLKEDSQFETR